MKRLQQVSFLLPPAAVSAGQNIDPCAPKQKKRAFDVLRTPSLSFEKISPFSGLTDEHSAARTPQQEPSDQFATVDILGPAETKKEIRKLANPRAATTAAYLRSTYFLTSEIPLPDDPVILSQYTSVAVNGESAWLFFALCTAPATTWQKIQQWGGREWELCTRKTLEESCTLADNNKQLEEVLVERMAGCKLSEAQIPPYMTFARFLYKLENDNGPGCVSHFVHWCM